MRVSETDSEQSRKRHYSTGAVRAGDAVSHRVDVPEVVVDVRAVSVALGAATVRAGGGVCNGDALD